MDRFLNQSQNRENNSVTEEGEVEKEIFTSAYTSHTNITPTSSPSMYTDNLSGWN
jgi:hypothetical protein